MKGPRRRGGWWLTAAFVVLVLGGIGPALVLLLDAGLFRGPLLAYAGAHFNRPIRVNGTMQLQLWSRHPRIVAQQVSIGNPPWVAAGEMAQIERLTLVFGPWAIGRGVSLESIAMQGATLRVLRDDKGYANWQRFNPDSSAVGKGAPLIRELSAVDAHLLVDDQLRHLHFDGTVSAQESPQTAEPMHLLIKGKGQLNGKPADLELSGDPLNAVRRDAPYVFEVKAEASNSRVALHGSLPHPFDFNVLDATFEAAGADLNDLYFLTGLTLVHTGAYRLSGNIARRGAGTRFDQLKLDTGQSDIAGSMSSQPQQVTTRPTPGGGVPPSGPLPIRSLLEGTLIAGNLRLADFGARAAGEAASGVEARGVHTRGVHTRGVQTRGVQTPSVPERLFSDAAINPQGLRRGDAQVRFEAQRVEVGSTVVQSLSGQLKIDHGVVTISALRGKMMQGSFEARMKLDANQEPPAAEVSMRFTDLQLAALQHKQGEPALEGMMHVRMDITGHGASLHQVAASANGSLRMTLPKGAIRVSLAELAGVDLRGLGLILTRNSRETAVRCAEAAFEAHDGTLTARSLIIDTLPVMIRGEGAIHLDTESVEIALRGEPKDLRLLRVNAPLLIRGPLIRPSVTIATHDSSVRIIDPGHGKDVNCTSLLTEAESEH